MPTQPDETVDDFSVVDGLVQSSFLLQAVYAETCARHGMTSLQGRMLGILVDREPTMIELAALMRLEKSSVTGLVDRAVARKLIRRRASLVDRRVTHIALTPLGMRRARAFRADVAEQVTGLMGEFAPSDIDQLTRTLKRLVLAQRPPGLHEPA